MAVVLKLEPGAPLWDSPAIRVRHTAVSNLTVATLAHQDPRSGQKEFVYVRVENTGADVAGAALCSTPGDWTPARPLDPNTAPAGWSVVPSATGRSRLQGPAGRNPSFDWVSAGAGYGWTPDGRFFAVFERHSNATWLNVWDIRPPSGPVKPVGTTLAVSDTLGVVPSAVNFGFNTASTAFVAVVPTSPPIQEVRCLRDNAVFSPNFTSGPTGAPLTDLVFSPCGGLAARVEQPSPQNLQPAMEFFSVAISSPPLGLTVAKTFQPRRNNTLVPGGVTATALGAKIRSTGSGLNGLQLTNASVAAVDDPERLLGVGVVVEARLASSTTTPAVAPAIGSGKATAALMPQGKLGNALWVEVAANYTFLTPPSGTHYCIVARADATATTPATDPAPPWTAFDVTDRHFAQKNIQVV